MFADVGEVARAALEEGAAGLARFSLQLLSPGRADAGEPGGRRRRRRSSGWARPPSSTSSTARASRSTRRATRCASSRATCRTSPRACPRWWSGRARCPRASCVLEGEAIALRPDGRPHPFQVTMRRFGRSKDVEARARASCRSSSFFFDCLYLEGEGPLVALPYAGAGRAPGRDRARGVAAAAPRDAATPTRRSASSRSALDAGHEGLMAKSLDAPYAAGQRGFHWLKLKSAHTLDLVVLAVEWGSGRRQGWLSNLHLGARDAESGQFVMLGKTFKGLTDEMLRVADGDAARAGDGRDGYVGARAAGAGGRDRLQRRAGVAALPGGPGAALRARQALPAGQARGRGGHAAGGARDLRAPAAPEALARVLRSRGEVEHAGQDREFTHPHRGAGAPLHRRRGSERDRHRTRHALQGRAQLGRPGRRGRHARRRRARAPATAASARERRCPGGSRRRRS